MKKLTILAVMLMVSAAAFAQTNFRFGVTGGMNLSSANFSIHFGNLKSRFGYNAGVIGELSFANNFYGNISALYSDKGYKFTSSDDDEDYTDKQKIDYIEVPVHVGYKYPVNDVISLLGEAGPYAGFLLSAKQTSTDKYEELGNNKDDFKKIDVGLGIKAGIEFSQRVRITVGYDWGLANFVKEGVNGKNKNFNVGMVVFF